MALGAISEVKGGGDNTTDPKPGEGSGGSDPQGGTPPPPDVD